MSIVPFEVTYPGTWLQLSDQQEAFEISGLLSHTGTCLVEAALTLGHYQEVRGIRPQRPDFERGIDRRRELELVIRAERGIPAYEQYEEVRLEVDRRLLRADFASGALPREYAHHLPFVHAKSFVYSIDAMRAGLVQLRNFSVAAKIEPALVALDVALPSLSGVRDSTAHADERVRGLARKKPVNSQPVENRFISAPHGGVMVIGGLHGDNFSCTLANGTYGELLVTIASFNSCVEVFQRVLDNLPWHGPPRLFPSPH